MLQSIWNHRGPYRVTAEASPPRAGAWPALEAHPARATLPTSSRTRPVASAAAAMRLPEPAHPLMRAMQQAKPDLGALIELRFQPMRRAVLATVCLRQALRDLSPNLPRAPHGLPGLPQVLLVHALATATGADTARAAAVLAALRQLDPQREIARAWRLRGEPCAAPSPDSVAAWQAAMELGATPAGMDVLQAVLDVPVPPCHRQAFAALLAAARPLARDSRQPATPASLLHGPCAPAPLADAAARLAGDAPARPALAGAPRAATSGSPVRLRSPLARSVPFSTYAMASWSLLSTSRPAAGIASALADTLVRHVARPVFVGTMLAAP